MSLLLISKAYSFLDDEDENAVASAAKEKNSVKDTRGDVESTVGLKCRTSLRQAKQLETVQNRSGLKKRSKKLDECSSRLNKLNTKSREKEETKLRNEDEVFAPSFLDLLDEMETKNAKKMEEQINEAPHQKIPSTGKKNQSERNRQKSSTKEVSKNSQQIKSLDKNQCIMCFKKFNRPSKHESHILTHIKEKPYFCNVCNESFAHISNFKFHKLIHTGKKPFQCSVCSASFNRQDRLRNHKRIHTGEKPYQCTICSKRFAVSCNLKRHERIHTNEKRFKCVFVTKHSLGGIL